MFDGYGDLEPERVSTSIQDLLVSVEMLCISIAMVWVFGWQPYLAEEKQKAKAVLGNLVSTFNQKDVLQETVRSFSFSNQKEKALEAATVQLSKQNISKSGPLGDSSPPPADERESNGGRNNGNTSSRYGTY